MLHIEKFTFNPFEENTYVVYDETGAGVVIDPGCFEPQERLTLERFITENKIQIQYLLNTHCHIDHVLGNSFVKEKYQVPFLIHAQEEPVLRSVKAYAPAYGFSHYHEVLPDQFLSPGQTVDFGNTSLEILFVPGHSPGHVAFYHRDSRSLLIGDVLFERSIGRTDLPGGNFDTLIQSIHTKVFSLPDDVILYPGHGNTTTVGDEKAFNPFCAITQPK